MAIYVIKESFMPSELDIFRHCAQMWIDRHGEEAELRAAEEYDAMVIRGDQDGVVIWQQIIEAIHLLNDQFQAPLKSH